MGRRTIKALSDALPRGTDPKSQTVPSKNSRIVAIFEKFLLLSEDLVFFYFDNYPYLN
jgi:hypothetical protein